MAEQPTADDVSVIRPGIPNRDGCPVLTRIKAFIVAENTRPTLEFTFRSRATGNPIDFSPVTAESDSASTSADDEDTVVLRVREVTGQGDGDASQVWEIAGSVYDATTGIVRAPLPDQAADHAGIYTLSWSFIRNGVNLIIEQGLVSVEPNLFGDRLILGEGPLTIGQIRMSIMDSSVAENPLLLDMEFGDDQILQALVWPIEFFNAQPPRLRRRWNTRNFPWKFMWLDGVLAQLHLYAAAHYRRNVLIVSGGGEQSTDKAKEREYLAAAQSYDEKWRMQVTVKKMELNAYDCVGSISSAYGSM